MIENYTILLTFTRFGIQTPLQRKSAVQPRRFKYRTLYRGEHSGQQDNADTNIFSDTHHEKRMKPFQKICRVFGG